MALAIVRLHMSRESTTLVELTSRIGTLFNCPIGITIKPEVDAAKFVVLSGLPTGHGKVRATRVVGGSTMTGEGRVVVGPNGTRHRRVVLHHAG